MLIFINLRNMAGNLRNILRIFSLSLLILSSISCANRVNVPETVAVNTAPVTGEITVKHVISIELPTIFTDNCKAQHPDDETAYNACITEYINSLLTLINGLNPEQLQQVESAQKGELK